MLDGVAGQIFGITRYPIGTPEELRAEGLDPRTVLSCAPKGAGVAGCPYYEDCIFRFTKNGGFRDHGPRNVLFFHKPHEGKARREFGACYWFMQAMVPRMIAGNVLRAQGKPNAEIIRVIGGEGDIFTRNIRRNVNADDPKAKPDFRLQPETLEVPKFPRPKDQGALTYEAQLLREERLRDLADPDLAEGLPSEEMDRLIEETEGSDTHEEIAETLGSEPEGDEPTVELTPAKGKKGKKE